MAFHFAKAPQKKQQHQHSPQCVLLLVAMPERKRVLAEEQFGTVAPRVLQPICTTPLFSQPTNLRTCTILTEQCRQQMRMHATQKGGCLFLLAAVAAHLPPLLLSPAVCIPCIRLLLWLCCIQRVLGTHLGMTWEGFGFVPRFALITSKPTRHLRG